MDQAELCLFYTNVINFDLSVSYLSCLLFLADKSSPEAGLLFFLGGITLLKQSEELQDRRLPTKQGVTRHKTEVCHMPTLPKIHPAKSETVTAGTVKGLDVTCKCYEVKKMVFSFSLRKCYSQE